ncbi:MAG: SRPBCC family protein [Prolixibacteraceae bacterium]
MKTIHPIKILVETTVKASVTKTWDAWTNKDDIMQWNTASSEWHTTKTENDLRPGGAFLFRMEAKDGSFGFDFYGIYDKIILNQLIEYTLGDDRKVSVTFQNLGKNTKIIEIFEAETENTIELQKAGWQAILDNFKKHTESAAK